MSFRRKLIIEARAFSEKTKKAGGLWGRMVFYKFPDGFFFETSFFLLGKTTFFLLEKRIFLKTFRALRPPTLFCRSEKLFGPIDHLLFCRRQKSRGLWGHVLRL